MKPTRIAYLVSRYPAVSHTFILREVRQLRELGFDIVPMSVNSPDRALSDMNADEFEETRRTFYLKSAGLEAAAATLAWALTHRPVACLKGLMAAWRLRKSFGLVKSLAYGVEAAMVVREMQRQGTEHLHVHFASAAASVALLAQQAFGIRLSMTVHGPDEFDNVVGQALAQKVAAADAIVCISDFARAQLMRLSEPRHWGKLSVARLGVDLTHHVPAASTTASVFTATTPARPRAPHMLCVGRLTPAKGQRLLLQAFAALPSDLAHTVLTVVGAGPDDADLQTLARELGIAHRVTFTGAQSEAQVLAHMQSADLFCLPSFAEGIPVVLMEAMACAVPCLSTTACGIPELVGHGEHGLLVRPGDVFGLTVAMVSLLRDTALRQRMGRAGRAQVSALYDLNRNIHDLADTLRQMPQAQRSRQALTASPALSLDRV